MDHRPIEEIGITDLEKFPRGVDLFQEKITLKTTCEECNKEYTAEVLKDHYTDWCEIYSRDNSMLRRDFLAIFPELTQGEIELHLINGVCESCWDKHYSEEK